MCLIGLISITSAAQITKIGEGRDPAVYDNKVTWSDTSGRIHIYDLITKKDTKISSSSSSHPAIYGNKMVWHDESSGTPRLTVYDIPSGARSYITKDVDSTTIPAIYGNRIVWSANYNETTYNYKVYMRDISTSKQTKIADGNNPDIYNTRIAYGFEDLNVDGRTIAIYDLNAKKTINAYSSSQVFNPRIYGNKVIWSNFYTRSGFIQMYDLVNKNTIDVTSDNTGNTLPGYEGSDAGDDTGTHIDIYGDKIVYSKSGNDQFGCAGVYVYDIPSAKSSPVYIYPRGTYTTPDIYNNTIVWGIDENFGEATDTGIYLYKLEAKPTADFSANKVSGKAPLSVQFTSKTTGNPTDYYWVFEPSTSNDWNSHHAVTAVHTFKKSGTYTVSLTVTNGAGSNTVTKKNYITVK
ncbi:MAG: PKD domain-containing protein [Methanosarcina sp.]